MANVYVDLDKSASTEDGTTWANAYRLPSQITGSSGDDVWIKGNTNTSAAAISMSMGSSGQNPCKIHGVKSATSAEPPAKSDLIPGWRTGEARTVANRAYNDADRPAIILTTDNPLDISGNSYWYGVEFRSAGEIEPGLGAGDSGVFEECLFELTGSQPFFLSGHEATTHEIINCGLETNNSGNQLNTDGNVKVIGLEVIPTTAPTGGLIATRRHHANLYGCDFEPLVANPILDIAAPQGSDTKIMNPRLHASAVLTTGTADNQPFRAEFHHASSVTGKTSGTIVDIDIVTESGNIVQETTAFRTSGANDGSSDWAFAFTPHNNGTRDNYKGLVGPWMAFKIVGDGSAQTVDVFIANSGAADYNDDDAWLEIMSPSAAGTALYDFLTTQMDLLDTPAVIADDTGSTWGTGGDNHQRLTASISPDYVGWAYCRVVFAKFFASSAETLYVDPLPVVS